MSEETQLQTDIIKPSPIRHPAQSGLTRLLPRVLPKGVRMKWISVVLMFQAFATIPLLQLRVGHRRRLRFKLSLRLVLDIVISAYGRPTAARAYGGAFISDLANVRYAELFDPIMARKARFFVKDESLSSLCLEVRIIARTAALLKWAGYLKAARLLYILLLGVRNGATAARLGLIDLSLLAASWEHELLSYRKNRSWVDITQVFPGFLGKEIVLNGSMETYFRRSVYLLQQLLRTPTSHPVALAASALHLRMVQRAAWYPELTIFLKDANLSSLFELTGVAAALGCIQNISNGRDAENRYLESSFRVIEDALTNISPALPCIRVSSDRQRKYLKSVEVLPLWEIASRLGASAREAASEGVQEYAFRVVSGGEAKEFRVERNLPKVVSCELGNVIDIGYGLMVVDEKYLVSDTKHLPLAQAQIFSPSIVRLDPNEALIEFDISAESFNGKTIYPVTGHSNYYHWLVETAGGLAAELGQARPDRIVTYKNLHTYQRKILNSFFPEHEIEGLLPEYPNQYRLESAHLVTHWSRDQIVRAESVSNLRKRVVSLFPSPTSTRKKLSRIFLLRKNTLRKDLVNEKAVASHLLRRGFALVDPAELSLEEQVSLFASCNVVAGGGGAAFANLTFCRPEAKVLLFGPETGSFDTFGSLAKSIGCDLWLCLGRVSRITPNPYFVWTRQEFYIDIKDIDICLDEMGL